jgi:hypothetical protein
VRPRVVLASIIAAIALMISAAARAATITVGTVNDSSGMGGCSLRDAITTANGTSVTGSGCPSTTDTSNTINFNVSGTITLTNTLPAIANSSPGSSTIDGSGQAITLDGANAYQILTVNSGATLNLNG